MKAATAFAIIFLHLSVCFVKAQPSGCSQIPIFESGYVENPLLCDGDAGGSNLYVADNSIEHTTVGANLGTSEDIRLDIWRRDSDGLVIFPQCSITKGGVRFLYSGAERIQFRRYFRELMLIVRQFETGECPVDSKNQRFPDLVRVRSSLAALAASFRVYDCGEDPVHY